MQARTTSSLQHEPKIGFVRGHLLQRKCACGGVCAGCRREKLLQAKLAVGASNDPLEREADRVADQVLAAPAHPAIQQAAPRIQRATGQATNAVSAAPASAEQVLASTGKPLDADLQQDMSQRFGHNFSQVRVHADAAAAQSAREMDARAYTVGKHVVFDQGQYTPDTPSGRRLLAHELTHVVQQGETSGMGPGMLQRERARRPAAPAPAPQPGQHVIPCPDPNAVSDAITLARNIIATALRRMDAGPSNIGEDTRSHGPMHFFYILFFNVEPGLRSAAQILEIKERFHTLSRAVRAVSTRCVAATHPDCSSGQMLHDGFAEIGASQQPVVNLCPSFFNGAAATQARTIIHELAHARLGIGHAGGRFLQFGCGATPLTNYDDAIGNAYVYDLSAYCLYAASQQERRRAAP